MVLPQPLIRKVLHRHACRPIGWKWRFLSWETRDVCFYQVDRNFDRELEGKGGLSAALRGLVSVSHVISGSYNNRIIQLLSEIPSIQAELKFIVPGADNPWNIPFLSLCHWAARRRVTHVYRTAFISFSWLIFKVCPVLSHSTCFNLFWWKCAFLLAMCRRSKHFKTSDVQLPAFRERQARSGIMRIWSIPSVWRHTQLVCLEHSLECQNVYPQKSLPESLSYLLLLLHFHYIVWVVMVMGSQDIERLLEKIHRLCEVIGFSVRLGKANRTAPVFQSVEDHKVNKISKLNVIWLL